MATNEIIGEDQRLSEYEVEHSANILALECERYATPWEIMNHLVKISDPGDEKTGVYFLVQARQITPEQAQQLHAFPEEE